MFNLFTPHKLTPRQEVEGSILTDSQKLVIQNRILEITQDLMNHSVVGVEPEIYLRAVGFSQGQLKELAAMLTNSDEAEQQLGQLED